MKTPKFLQDLILSPAYGNKNSTEYAQATKYMELLYPGTVQFDATGKMVRPAYDMTLEQFKKAQAKIDSDFEDAKQEATEEILEEYGEYFHSLGIDFNIDDYVVQDKIIPVKVLCYRDIIIDKNLLIYDLNIPDFNKQSKIWRWHSEQEEHTCDECAGRDGEVFWSEEDIPEIPVHPNCRCNITEDVIDEDGKTIVSKLYKNNNDKQEVQNMTMSDKGIEWLKQKEGSVQQDGKHVVYDDTTGKPVPDGAPLPAGATIGYGHLVKSGEDFKGGITEKQATELLKQDIASAENAVRNNISVPLTQNQYDALVSLAYNIGAGNFKNSTVVKYINNSDFHSNKYPTIESAWKAWNKQDGQVRTGLINRREYEWNIFENADYGGANKLKNFWWSK